MKQLAILFAILCLMLCSCAVKGGDKEFVPPFLEDIGKTQSEVFKKYGMSEMNAHGTEGENGLFDYPKEQDFFGLSGFSAAFYFDITSAELPLYGFTYYRVFEEDSKELLPAAKEIFQKLSSSNNQQKGVKGYGEDSIFSILEASSTNDLDLERYTDIWVSKDHQILIEYHLDKLQNQEKTIWVLWTQYRVNVWNNY